MDKDLEGQRKLIMTGHQRYLVDIMMEIICKFESANQTLTNYLPYIEGILIDTPEAIDDLIELSEESGKNIIACLNRIVNMMDNIFNPFIQDIAIRILTRVYSR